MSSKEAEKRWECFATLCKEMNALADEIIEWSADGHYRDRLINLYDLADTVFGAKNVKRLLTALEEKDRRIAWLEQQATNDSYNITGMISQCEMWQQKCEIAEQRLQQPIKLPDEKFCPAEYEMSLLWAETETWNKAITKCAEALRAQGFKVEGE